MPNYLDILQQFKDRNRVSRKYQSVNPYSSQGYTGFDARTALSMAEQEEMSESDIIPEEFYAENKPTNLEKGISAYQNISMSSKLLGDKSVTGLLGGIDTSLAGGLATTATTGIIPGAPAASTLPSPVMAPPSGGGAVAGGGLPGSSLTGMQSGILGSAAYALASDRNPYTYGGG